MVEARLRLRDTDEYDRGRAASERALGGQRCDLQQVAAPARAPPHRHAFGEMRDVQRVERKAALDRSVYGHRGPGIVARQPFDAVGVSLEHETIARLHHALR